MAYSKEYLASLAEKGQLLRRDCIKCIGVGVAGHVGGSCSAADLVVTGEGCLDRQTAFGKAPAGVAERAKRRGIPVIALAGGIKPGAEICNDRGIDAFFSILPRVMPSEEATEKETARSNMEQTAEQLFRLIRCLQA